MKQPIVLTAGAALMGESMNDERPEQPDPRLVESEERYRAVIDNASDMIQSIRPDTTFEFVNNAWLTTLGYTPEEVAGLVVFDVIHPDEHQHFIEVFGQVMRGQPVGQIRSTFVTKTGDLVPIEATATVRWLDGRPIATHGFIRDISERLRAEELRERNEQLEREQMARYLEKMAALGKLSSGLAHELNNPASAARRASSELLERMERRDAVTYELIGQALPATAWQVLDGIVAERSRPAAVTPPSDPLAISEQEESVEEWLESQQVGEAWNMAPDLVAAGITCDVLAGLEGQFPAPALAPAVRWLAESLAVRHAADVICRSAERMSDLVSAIKAYSYMDRAAEQLVDIHEGLDNTRIILAHQLKRMNVVVDYDRSLPLVRTYGSGLNQVWTNILDNAADSTGGAGALTIRTRRAGDNAVVEITDNGPGIPPEILTRIFEPFFTTKPQGSGAGLGLDTVWRIVTEEHRGTIEVESRPGSTTFRVSLPLAESTAGVV